MKLVPLLDHSGNVKVWVEPEIRLDSGIWAG